MLVEETKVYLSNCLPPKLTDELSKIDPAILCEIRLRAAKPVQFKMRNALVQGKYTPSQDDIANISEALCEHSLYTRNDEVRRGYVTLQGGHRMGLCGSVVWEKNDVRSMSDIGLLSIRIAREVHGAASSLLKYIKLCNAMPNMLIMGAPGTGKTTLLRDYVRLVSQNGITVGLVDERGELAACHNGVPQLDVGISTDVLDGCHKAYGIRWLIRSMSPYLIATDELSGMDDAMAILDARASGIRVATTVHASSMNDLDVRSDLQVLCHQKVFDLYVLLKEDATGEIEKIYNKEGTLWH